MRLCKLAVHLALQHGLVDLVIEQLYAAQQLARLHR